MSHLLHTIDEQCTSQVEVIRTAIKNTTVKKAARKKRAGYGDENMEPPTVTRTSSRRRVMPKVKVLTFGINFDIFTILYLNMFLTDLF